MGISRDDISETAWKWRCKLKQSLGGGNEKTLADFTADDVYLEDDSTKASSSSAEGLKASPGSRGILMAASPSASKDPGFGSMAAVKTLYEGPNAGESFVNWQDYPPRQMSKLAARAQDRVAIKLFKVKDKSKPVISGRFALKYHRLDIQNPLLVAALEPILKREDMHLDVIETATFNEPFRPLFFCYDDIVAAHRRLVESDLENPVRPFMLLLIKVLDEMFADIRTRRRALREKGLISFATAWTFFARDSEVVSWGHNCELLCKVVDTAPKKSPSGAVVGLEVRCKVLRFSGEDFGWVNEELTIPRFEGNQPILDLPHYPLEFHPEANELKSRMMDRGRRVLDYQGLSYCCYNGLGVFLEPGKKKMEKHNVDGRILIDVVGYKKHHLAMGSREEQDPQSKKNIVRGTGPRGRAGCGKLKPGAVTADETADATKKTTAVKRLTEEEQKANKEVMLRDESSLMFMYPLLEGYALKNKLWLNFYVEDIQPMAWNDQAFEHLVYDEQQKDLVLSFVENHGHKAAPKMVDVIMGKGQGLIILLSGPPGTGKTLTAEAVADKTKRPLFYLQAEDLGINAATLGANIKVVFQMATEWDAVILLDEADVFMAERHPQDIARNELVSIFLRELEYFRGIIFLTTNLYDTIDSAFRSRVSLHLLFKPLTVDARLVVWQKFLDRLPKKRDASSAGGRVVEVEGDEVEADDKDEAEAEEQPLADEDLKELSYWHLNGREIKNAVRMVRSWCDHKGYEMTLSRLENGIKVTSPHAAKRTHENDTSLYDD